VQNSQHTTFEGHRGMMAIQVSTPERLTFLKKVYGLFSLALVIFAGATWVGSTNEAVLGMVLPLLGKGFLAYILIMFAMFALLRMTASRFPLNLIGLGVFAVFEGLLTGPLVYYVVGTSGVEVVAQAAILTTVVFGSLTLFAWTSKKDFSFMRGALWAGLGVLVGFILLSFLFGYSASGWGVSAAFVLLMAGFVLYDTSNIMRHYPIDQAPAAAAGLFLNFVIMFRNILMLLARRD